MSPLCLQMSNTSNMVCIRICEQGLQTVAYSNRLRVGKMGGFILTKVTVLISSICHRFYIRSNFPRPERGRAKMVVPRRPA